MCGLGPAGPSESLFLMNRRMLHHSPCVWQAKELQGGLNKKMDSQGLTHLVKSINGSSSETLYILGSKMMALEKWLAQNKFISAMGVSWESSLPSSFGNPIVSVSYSCVTGHPEIPKCLK